MTQGTDGRSPVMADVARIAGVSHQTVSRVLNHHPNVRPATRDRVLAAIEQLGYRRNLSARALVTRRTNTLGVVAFDTTLYGPASTLFGLEQAARDAGYFISIVSLKTINRKTVGEALDYLAAQAVDGLIAIAPQVEAAAAVSALQGNVPVVAVEGGEAGSMPVVAVDQVRGAELATGHLLELGHRTVWHVAGPDDWLEADGRKRGWRTMLEAAGIEPPPVVSGDWSPRAGYLAGRQIVADGTATAVFVSNDQMALGLLRALHEAGIRVPHDVSIVGFDDIPESEFLTPPLTTIRQDFAEVGRKSIALLLDLIDTGPRTEAERIVVPPALVIRSSTTATATT